MPKLIVKLPSNRSFTGLAHLEDDRGQVLAGPYAIAGRANDLVASEHGNPGRDPLLPYGDTPLGSYRVAGLLDTGDGTAYSADQYGRHGAVILEATGGPSALAEAGGRFCLLIHGGKPGDQGLLRATNGMIPSSRA